MRLSYSPAAHVFLFLVQWMDCSLAGALGLLRILIYKDNKFIYKGKSTRLTTTNEKAQGDVKKISQVYVDGKTIMSVHERKASIREFYAVIFPSLLQLQSGITEMDDRKQRDVYIMKYRKKADRESAQLSEIDIEREEECGICMEVNSKVVLPNCNHAFCMKCYRDWRARSQSCPFCRESLKRVNSGDLWIVIDTHEIMDMEAITRENLRRLFMYIDKLPLIVPDTVYVSYDSLVR
ncbi:E3 ubiquitin-protein ligase rnf8-B isoform X3 [Amborella trichopoda]|nr:E3 ubiquitin-protein ligase rnf8-B isoform X3 [Amborella trichopoda]|eukprot:XP_020525291.1 E3 ubiquitin-protein ligase rnf8-B isoform X3 [Amborella trichopoda]